MLITEFKLIQSGHGVRGSRLGLVRVKGSRVNDFKGPQVAPPETENKRNKHMIRSVRAPMSSGREFYQAGTMIEKVLVLVEDSRATCGARHPQQILMKISAAKGALKDY